MYMYVYLSPRPREISRYSKPEQTKNKDLLTFAFWYIQFESATAQRKYNVWQL